MAFTPLPSSNKNKLAIYFEYLEIVKIWSGKKRATTHFHWVFEFRLSQEDRNLLLVALDCEIHLKFSLDFFKIKFGYFFVEN